jgi:uncharacterized protein (TIGR02466 family)
VQKTQQITEIRPFFTSIFTTDLEYDSKEMLDAIDQLQLYQGDNTVYDARGNPTKDTGTWQSFDSDYYAKNGLQTNKFLDDIGIKVKTVMDGIYDLHKVKKGSSTLLRYWVNRSSRSSYNANYSIPHVHPSAYFSAVLYTKASENCGNLCILRSDNFTTNVVFDKTQQNEYNWNCFNIVPKEKRLVIFPAHLYHFVFPNFSEEEDSERISIAYDFL